MRITSLAATLLELLLGSVQLAATLLELLHG